MSHISLERILEKLDGYFSKNDYKGACDHLLYWLREAESIDDKPSMLAILNELAGLYRKISLKQEAFDIVAKALWLIDEMGINENIGAGTTYLNCATVYKAFSLSEKALPLFLKAEKIYEKGLKSGDKRFGGLYNNMALALVDLKRFREAYDYYQKAISVMEKVVDGDLEVAITYLNIASLKEAELGLVEAEPFIKKLLKEAMKLLDTHTNRNGYYAFVCEKCASVFGYYGYFAYEKELLERVRIIYERP